MGRSEDKGRDKQIDNVSDLDPDEYPVEAPHPDYVENVEGPIFPKWTEFTHLMKRGLLFLVHGLSKIAIHYPKSTIIVLSSLSLLLIGGGLVTNFRMELDTQVLYTPFSSLSKTNLEWAKYESGMNNGRQTVLLVHKNGNNVLDVESMRRTFKALDCVRKTPDYEEICRTDDHKDFLGVNTCRIQSATRFWYHNSSLFENSVRNNEDLIEQLSSPTFPGDTPAVRDFLLGKHESTGVFPSNEVTEAPIFWNANGTLSFVESYIIRIEMPDLGERSDKFDENLIDNCLAMKEDWAAEEANEIVLDFWNWYAYSLEFSRAFEEDLPLVGVMIIVMFVFTTFIFSRRHDFSARRLLGCAAVGSVILSLLAGYGALFLCGVPFTNLTAILPFIIIGVGLDDIFILSGAFFRTNPNTSFLERIYTTIEQVGLSISATTMSTLIAFGLGSMSSIPAIHWICIYAAVSMFLVFIYQLTVFIAYLRLDDLRIQSGRNDCCAFLISQEVLHFDEQQGEDDENDEDTGRRLESKTWENFETKLMSWYADALLRKSMKRAVIGVSILYFLGAGFATYLLTQDFQLKDFLPEDSHVTSMLDAVAEHFSYSIPVGVYFRGVDQTEDEVQEAMIEYIEDLAELDVFTNQIPLCWVRDLQEFKNSELNPVRALPFSVQLEFAMTDPTIREAYGEDIVLNDDGSIISSRCWLLLDPSLDLNNVKQQLIARDLERGVTLKEEKNEDNLDHLNFFSVDTLYLYWEFYDATVEEVTHTIISGVVALCAVSLVFVNHWSAIYFIFPMIASVYLDILGTLQVLGLRINVVTHLCLVMSIGVLVDYLLHILLRYYKADGETREEKVKNVLKTMGASIFVGGLTTLLGVIPLVFSTTELFKSVCICFFAMIAVGMAHGLILLPVVLSIFGPVVSQEEEQIDSNVDQTGARSISSAGKTKSMETPDMLERMSFAFESSNFFDRTGYVQKPKTPEEFKQSIAFQQRRADALEKQLEELETGADMTQENDISIAMPEPEDKKELKRSVELQQKKLKKLERQLELEANEMQRREKEHIEQIAKADLLKNPSSPDEVRRNLRIQQQNVEELERRIMAGKSMKDTEDQSQKSTTSVEHQVGFQRTRSHERTVKPQSFREEKLGTVVRNLEAQHLELESLESELALEVETAKVKRERDEEVARRKPDPIQTFVIPDSPKKMKECLDERQRKLEEMERMMAEEAHAFQAREDEHIQEMNRVEELESKLRELGRQLQQQKIQEIEARLARHQQAFLRLGQQHAEELERLRELEYETETMVTSKSQKTENSDPNNQSWEEFLFGGFSNFNF